MWRTKNHIFDTFFIYVVFTNFFSIVICFNFDILYLTANDSLIRQDNSIGTDTRVALQTDVFALLTRCEKSTERNCDIHWKENRR